MLTPAELEQRVAAFVRGERHEGFDDLCRAAFALQYERLPGYRRLCAAQGVRPADVRSWRQIPPVPSLAFKTQRLCVAEPQVVFRSSGTTAGDLRSEHHQPFPDLYRLIVRRSFPAACMPGRAPNVPMLSLIPTLASTPDSSLAFMIDEVIDRFADPRGTLLGLDEEGLAVAEIVSWFERHGGSEPCLVLATAISLWRLLDRLEERDLVLDGSQCRIFETGGFKTLEGEIGRSDLLERCEHRLGVPPERIVREYGMTELTSQCYDEPETASGRFFSPAWMAARVLDPVTLQEVEHGETGVLCFTDLGNAGSALSILTEDLGRDDGTGFQLLGRLAGSEIRGCSLTAAELLGAPQPSLPLSGA